MAGRTLLTVKAHRIGPAGPRCRAGEQPAHRRDAGISLVEITIVLTVIAILTAATAPVAMRSVDRSRLSRAASDAQAIRTAIANFLTDMPGYTGFTINGDPAGTAVQVLVSDGDIASASGATGTSDWVGVVDNTGGLVDFLARHLVTNLPRNDVANDYPVSGTSTWRGAYLTAPVDPDPWGNRYAVNVRWLKDAPRSNDVFVLSAGPDEQVDTAFAVNGAAPSDDDIIVVVRRDPGLTVP